MSAAPRHRIELRLRDLAQLFNSLDPSPFVDRDIDAAAEEFIVGWARELHAPHEFDLRLHLAAPPAADRAAGVEQAVRHYFASRAAVKDRELRLLWRRGRSSLAIGLGFLAVCFGLAEAGRALLPGQLAALTELGLQIVGWVAMWRPLEIYLYDWWPVRGDRNLLRRLARMTVRLQPPADPPTGPGP